MACQTPNSLNMFFHKEWRAVLVRPYSFLMPIPSMIADQILFGFEVNSFFCFHRVHVRSWPISWERVFILPTGQERLEWNETNRGHSFHFMLFLAVCAMFGILGNQPLKGWTESNPTQICRGTAQLDSMRGIPSRRQRLLLGQRMIPDANRAHGLFRNMVTGAASAPWREDSFGRK